jgi:uncharacterized protein
MVKLMIIGIISDTHGLLRTEVKNNLKDCDLIIHAGDIGNLELIKELKNISKVEYVKGNCDKKYEFNDIKEYKIIKLEEVKIYIVHDIKTMRYDLDKLGINIVVYGHSHKNETYIKNDILYINPGSVGPKRFKLQTTMAKLYINYKDIKNSNVEFIKI